MHSEFIRVVKEQIEHLNVNPSSNQEEILNNILDLQRTSMV